MPKVIKEIWEFYRKIYPHCLQDPLFLVYVSHPHLHVKDQLVVQILVFEDVAKEN